MPYITHDEHTLVVITENDPEEDGFQEQIRTTTDPVRDGFVQNGAAPRFRVIARNVQVEGKQLADGTAFVRLGKSESEYRVFASSEECKRAGFEPIAELPAVYLRRWADYPGAKETRRQT